MDLEPTSETGRRVFTVLRRWMEKSPEMAVDKVKKIFLRYSLDILNEDAFITILYAQSVLEDSPSVLSQKFRTPLLGAQHAIETSVNKTCLKELVVALEMSGNGGVLAGVLNWTMENSQVATQRAPTDLAPVSVQKRRLLLSELIAAVTVKLRHRAISWEDEDKLCSTLEACKDKIIVGWNNGQIGIYTASDLSCQLVLPYYVSPSEVTCLQCTCTQIIAGYKDGNIYVWNLENGFLAHQLSVRIENGSYTRYAVCMRWKAPRLVVATTTGIVKIWQHCGSSSFELLSSWDGSYATHYCSPIHVDFNEMQVILHPFSECVDVKYFNGQKLRSISNPTISHVALDGNHIITVGYDRVVRIWSISTGACFKELKERGHDSPVCAIDAHDGVIATGDCAGHVIVWSSRLALLEGAETKLADFRNTCFRNTMLRLGQKFLVTECTGQASIQVIDFLA